MNFGGLPPRLAGLGLDSKWRRHLRDAVVVLGFNTLCALLLTALDLIQGYGLKQNLVYAHAIGFTTFFGCTLVIRLCRSLAAALVANFVAVSLGIPLGWAMGSLLLGEPLDPLINGFANNWQRIIMLVAGVTAVWLYFSWSAERLAHARASMAALESAAETSRQQSEKRTLAAQFQALQAQIEPHFLFNTLANLRSLIGIDQERAQFLLDQLTDWLRAALQASRREETTLRDEFDLLQHYLEIQSLRLGNRLRFSSALPGELADFRLPPLLVQPLVENAVRHGIEPTIDGGWIGLSAFAEQDHIAISVADSGVGLSNDPSGPDAQDAVGLENIRSRLQLRYGDRASLHIQSRPEGGLIALIRVPRPEP